MSALAEHLLRFRPDLLRHVERRGGAILRFETADDLVQGIHLRALEREAQYEHRGRETFLAWMYEVARNHLATRRAHWSALKRRPAGLLRFTQDLSTNPAGIAVPAARDTGPATLAGRIEDASRAVRALDLLLERDQQLVQWANEGATTAEVADRLGISSIAAERARQRALGRFRKAYRLLTSR